jgi:hypothetical protein
MASKKVKFAVADSDAQWQTIKAAFDKFHTLLLRQTADPGSGTNARIETRRNSGKLFDLPGVPSPPAAFVRDFKTFNALVREMNAAFKRDVQQMNTPSVVKTNVIYMLNRWTDLFSANLEDAKRAKVSAKVPGKVPPKASADALKPAKVPVKGSAKGSVKDAGPSKEAAKRAEATVKGRRMVRNLSALLEGSHDTVVAYLKAREDPNHALLKYIFEKVDADNDDPSKQIIRKAAQTILMEHIRNFGRTPEIIKQCRKSKVSEDEYRRCVIRKFNDVYGFLLDY